MNVCLNPCFITNKTNYCHYQTTFANYAVNTHCHILIVFLFQDNSATHDFVRYDLGMITNTGQRSRPEDNLISIQFTARLLPNPLVVPGATFIANVGVRHSDNLIWVAQRTITVAGSLNETGVSIALYCKVRASYRTALI